MVMHNTHQPTDELKQRVIDLVRCGTPKHLIAEVIEIDDATLNKHYAKELKTAKTTAIERIGKTVYQQALEGNNKAQALYLKTQGADHGWVEKQVIEQRNDREVDEMRKTIEELEEKYQRDY